MVSGNRNNVPITPATIHHQAISLPLTGPLDCRMIRQAFTPRRKAISDPTPATPVIEKAKAVPSSLLILICNLSSGVNSESSNLFRNTIFRPSANSGYSHLVLRTLSFVLGTCFVSLRRREHGQAQRTKNPALRTKYRLFPFGFFFASQYNFFVLRNHYSNSPNRRPLALHSKPSYEGVLSCPSL